MNGGFLIKPRKPFTFGGPIFLLNVMDTERRGEECRTDRRAGGHRCIAQDENGFLCGSPARYYDSVRGGYVCEQHKPETRE